MPSTVGNDTHYTHTHFHSWRAQPTVDSRQLPNHFNYYFISILWSHRSFVSFRFVHSLNIAYYLWLKINISFKCKVLNFVQNDVFISLPLSWDVRWTWNKNVKKKKKYRTLKNGAHVIDTSVRSVNEVLKQSHAACWMKKSQEKKCIQKLYM